ncbi:MAG: T9SS type A sorting domain-containing protein [Candidatus Brennerbacteria bacterium]|nr:T9SS type A sorting domain-containing protein [Candidatus Brennerbacteria bacterium]
MQDEARLCAAPPQDLWKTIFYRDDHYFNDEKEWTQIVADTAYTVKGESLLVGTSSALYRVDGAIDTPVSVEEDPGIIPFSFGLSQNYPNPFNPSTTITFSLPDRSHVRLTVYNAIGQEVVKLVDEEVSAGTHKTTWDATGFPSGVYFARLETKSFVATRKMILLK